MGVPCMVHNAYLLPFFSINLRTPMSMHLFHIPVMGTGHTIDSPIRVAHLGITSVISIVDDHLTERIRAWYAKEFDLPFNSISRNATDSRARRITAYLDLVQDIVEQKFDSIKKLPFVVGNDKYRYFDLLPDSDDIKRIWNQIKEEGFHLMSADLEQKLNSSMVPGSIDVNIMSKVDRMTYDKQGNVQPAMFSDASSALRGYANSKLQSALVLSAGFNPRLYGYLSEFQDFYRDASGNIRKKIILKVSDFRSALVQGKFLAKKGLEIAEFRIESGLNCGGHAFPSDGQLLPTILREFREKREQLMDEFRPLIRSWYDKMGWDWHAAIDTHQPLLTVQGGVGTHGEMQRLMEVYGADLVGWGSPFLLVPEATNIDEPTLKQLVDAKESDLYLSNVSPLGVPFNNIRGSGSEEWTTEQINKGKSGSPCPKGFLATNTEFAAEPICTASNEYQEKKLAQIAALEIDEALRSSKIQEVYDKTCLCDHLGNGSLINLGIVKDSHGKQAICPGPNIAWFGGPYTLQEMLDHVYGRSQLTPSERPHMFAKELEMYVDYLSVMVSKTDPSDTKAMGKLMTIHSNLLSGIEELREISESESYSHENLTSLKATSDEQAARLMSMDELMAVAHD